MVKERFSDAGVNFVIQAEQKGTGHAVMMTEKNLKGQDGDVLVLCGDCPLITPKTIMALYSEHRDSGSEATVLSAELEDPSGYGRIVRREDGSVDAIVEQKDAGSDILAIKEVNSGIYIFKNKSLFDALGRIGSDNSQNEYYLTDTVSIIRKNGGRVAALRVIDPSEIMGVNNIEQLEGLEAIINNKKIL
ncbi:MAG: sugar phosphate nucleotidyltransferase, partial [Fibrobacterota bacterium]